MNTPNMTPGTVEMVSVVWLMQNLESSVDGYTATDDEGFEIREVDFASLILGKGGDGYFGTVLNTIVTQGFRVPICLYKPWGKGGWGLGNGHHRMAASILLCLDQIPVFWSEGDYMSTEQTDTECLLPDEGDFVDASDMVDDMTF